MEFYSIYIGLSILCFAYLMIAFLRPSGTKLLVGRQASLLMYKNQLLELDHDLARGVIPASDISAAKIEIKRRILSLDSKVHLDRDPVHKNSKTLAVFLALFIPVMGTLIYMKIAQPMPSQVFAEREEERQVAQEVTILTQTLKDRLLKQKNGGASDGWVLLGQTYMGMKKYKEAAEAFGVVAKRNVNDSAIYSRYGEALIAAENGMIIPYAERQIDKALMLDQKNPAAIYYKALALEQADDLIGAYQILTNRILSENKPELWMENLVVEVNRIGEKLGKKPFDLSFLGHTKEIRPSREQIENANNMSVKERDEFIQSMVDRLAVRLQENPDDLDGWLDLANAYKVLGKNIKARDAFKRARALLGKVSIDDPRREIVAKGLKD